MKQFNQLKKQDRNLKVLLSIGGWSNKVDFKIGVNTPEKRQQFAKSSVALVQNFGFDGIDIDWEYPSDDNEAGNLIDLIKTCRRTLDNSSMTHQPDYRFLLTIASPVGPEKNYFRFRGMADDVNHYNLMAYDYAGSFSPRTAHSANLKPSTNTQITPFSTSRAVQDYLGMGIKPGKIVLGIPLYGHAFNNTAGFGTRFTDPEINDQEYGIWYYSSLPRPGTGPKVDKTLGASYTYDSAKRELISFDTPEVVKIKTQYVMENQLGGVMFWETSMDKRDEQSLVHTLFNMLKPEGLEVVTNCITYPISRFENLRDGTI